MTKLYTCEVEGEGGRLQVKNEEIVFLFGFVHKYFPFKYATPETRTVIFLQKKHE